MKIGFEHNQVKLRVRLLVPEKTTERPGYVSAAEARPIISSPGQHVVIIGKDAQGDDGQIGRTGIIAQSPAPILDGFACVYNWPPSTVVFPTPYFHENSLCRTSSNLD